MCKKIHTNFAAVIALNHSFDLSIRMNRLKTFRLELIYWHIWASSISESVRADVYFSIAADLF